jgi:repressor of nif and glnA expression
MSPALKFVNHSIDDYAMKVTYEPGDGTGTVVYNLSVIKKEDLEYAIPIMKDAYKTGICFSGLVRFFEAGEKVTDYQVPADSVAIATVCSTTLDGLLLRRGVPENPIGGGVVEVERRVPRRFIHMILYEHTTIDPLQVLISQEITSITDVMRRGSGNILANVRECHMEAESLIGEVLDDLSAHGFSGTLEVGLPNSPILGVAVDPQYLGIAAVGGTNQMAAIKEGGYPVLTQAMKGLIDVQTMAFIRDY